MDCELLAKLIQKQRATMATELNSTHFVHPERGQATHPLFWFPNVVNNYVVRVTSFQVFVLAFLSAAFTNDTGDRYCAVALLTDFGLRFMGASSVSFLGMIAIVVTSPLI